MLATSILYYSVITKCDMTVTTVTLCHREGEEKVQWEKGTEHTSRYIILSYVYGQHRPHNVMIYGFDSFSIFFCSILHSVSRHLAVRFGSSILQNLTFLWIHAVWLAKTERGVKPWCSLCFTFSPIWLLFVFILKFLQFFFNMSSMTAGIWRNIIFEMLYWNLFWGEAYHTLRKKQDYKSFFY